MPSRNLQSYIAFALAVGKRALYQSGRAVEHTQCLDMPKTSLTQLYWCLKESHGFSYLTVMEKQGPTAFLPDFGIWFQTAGHTRTSLLPCTHLSGLRIIHLLIFSCSLMKMSETGRWGGRMIERLVHVGCLCFGDGLLRCFSLQLIMEPDFQKYLGVSKKKWLRSFSELPCY